MRRDPSSALAVLRLLLRPEERRGRQLLWFQSRGGFVRKKVCERSISCRSPAVGGCRWELGVPSSDRGSLLCLRHSARLSPPGPRAAPGRLRRRPPARCSRTRSRAASSPSSTASAASPCRSGTRRSGAGAAAGGVQGLRPLLGREPGIAASSWGLERAEAAAVPRPLRGRRMGASCKLERGARVGWAWLVWG